MAGLTFDTRRCDTIDAPRSHTVSDMDGQVLGGGVVILVAAVLWLAYLLPSWHARYQYNATERNAVRLSQALRVLAETSERPEAVEVELQTRSAHRQTKLARKAEGERQKLEEAAARAEAERVREEAEFEKEQLRAVALEAREQRKAEIVAERSLEKARIDAERARASADAAAEHERLRRELVAARQAPAAVAERQARARRTVRLSALLVLLAGIGLLVWGIVASLVGLAVAGVVAAFVAIMLLQRMAGVSRRAVRREVVEVVAEASAPRERIAQFYEQPAMEWTPRALPQPLSNVAGSRAAVVHDAQEAREALRRAALEEAARARAAEQAPVRIETARPAAIRATMDDATIEAHVRELLNSRRAG